MIFSAIKYHLIKLTKRLTFSPIKYWEERAKKYGELSVLNLSHGRDQLQAVKDFQIQTIFPILKTQVKGNEKMLLDFGCGPGRFTRELAELIKGQALGIDPIEHLLCLAPQSKNVSYKKIINAVIPAADKTFDVIWICLVLGGITSNKQLQLNIKEINRVSKPDSLLFLIENTTNIKDTLTWKYRSIEKYLSLFNNFNLRHLKDYEDLGERISIFSGRRVA